MRSRLLVNIILLLLVGILMFIVYTGEDESTGRNKGITAINADSVNKIRIIHKDRTIALKKNHGQWYMTQPIQLRANDFRVSSLLNILKTPSHASYASTELDLSNYDLDNAQTSITFNNTEIIFGIVNPVNDFRYVKVDDQVHLIDDFYYPLISSQIGTLVALNPLPSDAEIIRLVLPEQTLEINEQGLWQSSKPVSADAINETVQSWKNDQAFGVHNYIKRESLGDIDVYIKDQDKPIHFEITDTEPWLIIARPELDLEYHFNIEFYDRLLRPGSEAKPTEEPAE